MTPHHVAYVTADPIDAAALEAAVARPDAGACVVFSGIVRDHDQGRAVTRLEYEAHPTAAVVLAEVVAEFAALGEVRAVAAAHRMGPLKIGDTALVAAVAAAHRKEAFEICGRLVDEIKHRLPIWKLQAFDDGTEEWVNCP